MMIRPMRLQNQILAIADLVPQAFAVEVRCMNIFCDIKAFEAPFSGLPTGLLNEKIPLDCMYSL